MRRSRRIIFAIAIGVPLACAATIALLPIPRALRSPVPGTLRLLDVRGGELATIASTDAREQLPVPLSAMGQWLPRVTVALEDRRFYEHHGVDWKAALGAAAGNARAGRIVSGASTITQQLVKLSTGRRGRSWSSKCYEIVIAWKLERRWTKDRILAEYLNRSSYGNRRLGPEAAARAYFGKSAKDLTLAEAIYVSGLPQAPTRLNPWTHPDAAQRRYQRSLERLEKLGVIDSGQRALFVSATPVVQRHAPARNAPHFVDAVIAQNGGQRGTVRTTLDPAMQSTAEHLLRAHRQALNRHDISQAALVVLDNATGAVRALVGSDNYATAQINGAMRARSCGSTLKPFLYLAAVDRRALTAASLLPDTADAIRGEYADYDPQNFSHHYLGPVRMREALACSLNVPAVYTLSRLGARETFHELSKWGFDFPRTLDSYGAGFVLGNAETKLVNLAAAYAGLARGGVAMPAKFLVSGRHEMRRVASREATAIITDILCDNEARERSFGMHSPLALPQRVAVKTGTSSGFRDTWTVGFNKQHTVAVWAGNFDGRPMRDVLAVRGASPLWASMMSELLRTDAPLDPPAGSPELTQTQVSRKTGLLPVASEDANVAEWFLAGTEPSESSAKMLDANGALVLPGEYAAWCATADNRSGAHVQATARILSPARDARFEIDGALPVKQQMIELRASMTAGVQWFVNDDPQQPREDGRVWWQLARGEWRIRAVGPDSTAETRIVVQ